ncbi:MAG: HAD family hydrolase [Planctomycetaceae bacterium]|nr:MAG: HAD family hydrolase [Planctomycetaceae bacterium]
MSPELPEISLNSERTGMKYDAIIFDLFGTLVDNCGGKFADRLRQDGLLADMVGGREDEFTALWDADAMYLNRVTGNHRLASDCVRHICSRMGIAPDPRHVERIQQCRMEYVKTVIDPRSDVIPTLSHLRQRGLKLGLITVCTWEVSLCWQASEVAGLFDVAVFSCAEGLTKPDPRLYQRTCEWLGTSPERCLYVGDGSGDELAGAKRCGMDAVLICAPHEEHIVMERSEARNWTGLKISAIGEMLGLIDQE